MADAADELAEMILQVSPEPFEIVMLGDPGV
jgi:hypothetical protein